jgi:hypothetical protein
MDEKSVFETRLSAGKRTYYFDVKEAANGNRYLKLSEVSMREGKEERSRIFLFQDHAKEFAQALEEALKHLNETNSTRQIQ